ncbi:hypothetical protein VSR17_21625 [Cupriavidus taiwanensis]|uniref:Uncharacterized protein n=1 Tax=Cupriavidus taiwanensis TaxID=164546 RepID=A0A375IEC2_9BURK|nr:hypothetical protein [Cupriavidus taiwanensis]SOY43450.1 conserved hypothetical protein [Cupriavidus taiwanensis]SOY59214.1 conserved hypothetical protein [Cupriavidus taiwanensis]SOY80176.1 conserved hypothetical protein [Cupriavidus taiwanensis]SOZ20940.1 conserved hypothetical protein [Cupriavidus taiwanensis]SOZ51278.1 conserved hypothetical protein [Cupriavidus taiwanensis]
MLALPGVAQPLSSPEDLWRAIAALSAGQLHTIIDLDHAAPGPTGDLDSFRRRIAGVFGNVAGFAPAPPPEPIVRAMWEKYRG